MNKMDNEDYQRLLRINSKQRRKLIGWRMAGHLEVMAVRSKVLLEDIIKNMFRESDNEEDHDFLGFKTHDKFQEAQYKCVDKMSNDDFIFLEMFWSRLDRISIVHPSRSGDDTSVGYMVDAMLFDRKGKLSILPI